LFFAAHLLFSPASSRFSHLHLLVSLCLPSFLFILPYLLFLRPFSFIFRSLSCLPLFSLAFTQNKAVCAKTRRFLADIGKMKYLCEHQ
jgi:hypothetical protein